MDRKILMLAAAIAVVAGISISGFIVFDDTEAAVSDPTFSETNVTPDVTRTVVTNGPALSFELKLTGPYEDEELKIQTYWLGAEKGDKASTGTWSTIYNGSTTSGTVNKITLNVAMPSLYTYKFTCDNIGTTDKLLLIFFMKGYTGAGTGAGTEVSGIEQKIIYEITLVNSGSEDLTFTTGTQTYTMNTEVKSNNDIAGDVATPTSLPAGKWYALGLPDGLTMLSNGTIVGTPKTAVSGVSNNVTVVLSCDDSRTFTGKYTILVTATKDPKVTLTNVGGEGIRALTASGETNDSERYLTYTGNSVTFDITGENIANSYGYTVYAVDASGEKALDPGSGVLVTVDGKKNYSFTPAGEGEFNFKLKLFDSTGALLKDSELLFSVLVIQQVQDIEAGIVFTPVLTPATP